MQDAKEEVRARLNIEDVVGEYVQLKRAGRNFKGLSPFTNEKSPSFVVSPEKHIWHDFSSGKGGDVFSFVMAVEGVDFRGALEQLARKAGIDLSQYANQQSGELARKKKRLSEANELAAQYYQQSLLQNKHALEYVFKTRGLSKSIVQQFRIGYAPQDGDALVKVLEKRGFSRKELGEAGLTNRFGGDIFRGRMTVPLMDTNGQVIGFTGRIIVDDPKAPKYLNTPQTLLYDKSRHVFGLSQAKEAIRQQDATVLVEGNLDVVSSHQVEVSNVVATAGTALTEWQLKSLSRLSSNVKLAFDGDRAGVAATERAIPIADRVGVELTVVTLPETVKDPDELIKLDPMQWRQVIEKSVPAVDWIIDQYEAREDLSTAAGKRNFTSASLAVVRTLSDEVVAEHYKQRIASLVDTSLDALERKFKKTQQPDTPSVKKEVKIDESNETESFNTIQDNVLGLLVLWPDMREQLADFDTTLFYGQTRQRLASFLTKYTKPIEPLPSELQEIETYVRIVELKAETRYEAWTDNERSHEVARLLRHMITERKQQTKQELLSRLRDAEEVGDDTAAATLRQELHKIIKETARG